MAVARAERRRREAPPLCPGLAFLAPLARSPRAYRSQLLDAACLVAVDPKVVPDGKFRLFCLAWVARRPLPEVAELLGISVGAAREQLRRVSSRIERRLETLIGGHVTAAQAEDLRSALREGRDGLRAACCAVLAGLAKALRSAQPPLGLR